MADQDDVIDEAGAATITANIERAFAFMADVIDDPRILELVPDGSRLVIGEAWIGGQHLRLVAFRLKDADRWGARVIGLATGTAGIGAGRGLPHSRRRASRDWVAPSLQVSGC